MTNNAPDLEILSVLLTQSVMDSIFQLLLILGYARIMLYRKILFVFVDDHNCFIDVY